MGPNEKKIHEEIAREGAKEAQFHKKPGHYDKWVSFMSVFLAVLFVAWIFAGFPVGDIIRGQLESTQLESGVLKLDDFTIEFEEESLFELLNLYYENQEVEFSVCLLGEFNENILFNDKYVINSLYVPTMYEQSYSHVNFESCNSSTIIMLHTHPYKSCLASQTDLDTLASNQEWNPNLVMVVMCEPGRFSVYR